MAGKESWRDLAIGGIITNAGNAREYETGSWRTFKPVLDKEKCTNCMLCWIFCPDSAIIVEDEDMKGFDMVHCKGCGICAVECPVKCIEMVLEESPAEAVCE